MDNNKSQLKIGVVLNYINLIVGNLIPVFYTPIMLRLLGQSEYGLYKLSATFTSYLSLISLGIGSAVTRYLIKARVESGKEEEEKYLGLFVIIFRIISLVAFVVGLALTFTIQIWYGKSLNDSEISKMKVIVFIMVCNTVLNFLQTPHLSIVTSHERFLFQQTMNIIATTVLPIVNLVVLFFGAGSTGVALSSLCVTLIIRVAYYIYVNKQLKIKANTKSIPKNVLKEILLFSFWIFVANVVTQLYNTTDTVMIGMIPALATTGVAVYNVGAVFNGMVTSLTTGISSTLLPATNKAVFSGATTEELTNMAIKVGRIQAYIISLVVTGFVAFGKPFVYFFAGEDYSEAYWVAVLMMVPSMIPLVQNLCLNIIVAQNKHKFRSLVYLAIAIVNVVGSWFALKKWGIVGAAAITGIALLIGQGFVMNWYYKYKIGLGVEKFWIEIAKIYAFPVILCVISLLISNVIDFYSIPVLLIGIVVYAVAFILFSWLFVMNDYEKSILLVPINKIKTKLLRK